MDNKDRIIQEQREQIRLLNEEIKRLQTLLSRAGISYSKGIQEKEVLTVRQADPAMSEPESSQDQCIMTFTLLRMFLWRRQGH